MRHALVWLGALQYFVHPGEQCPVYCTLLHFIMTVEIVCGQNSIESWESGDVKLHDPTICGR